MKKIRKSVFETNSSSSHVLHIDHETELMDTSLVPNEDGIIEIMPNDDYGWEYEKYNMAIDKIMYAIVDQGNDNNCMEMLREVIMEQTGAKEVILHTDHDCYIDHESAGLTRDAFKAKEVLRNFIFNKKSAVFTGNDNDDAPQGFYCTEETAVYKVRLISVADKRNDILSTLLIDDNGEEVKTKNEWMYTLKKPKDDYYFPYEYRDGGYFKDFQDLGNDGWFTDFNHEDNTIYFQDRSTDTKYKYLVEVELNDKKNESIPI